jgi:hypothetical protein
MFIWDEKPKTNQRRAKEQRGAMFKKEIEDRAGLLLRLGYKAVDVKSRLRKSVDWDFDLSDVPDHASEVDRIVDDVYKSNHK